MTLRRAFGNLPKSAYWQRTAQRHIGTHGLTIAVVMETLLGPTVSVEQP